MKGKGFFTAVLRHRRRVLAGYARAAGVWAVLSLLGLVNHGINDHFSPPSLLHS